MTNELHSAFLETNGFKVSLSSRRFSLFMEEMPNNEGFKQLRDELDAEWFLYWSNGRVYGLPKIAQPTLNFGTPVERDCNDYLQLIAARIVGVLPQTLPDYEVYRRRPYTIKGGKNIVGKVVDRMERTGLAFPLARQFFIQPRYELDAKTVELVEGNPFIGIFLNVKMRWEVKADLEALQKVGVDLRGLYVVRREAEMGQRRLIGRIDRIEKDVVVLSDSFDNQPTIPTNEVFIEGSKQSFARCLKVILGSRYADFEDLRDAEEAEYFTGPALDAILVKAQGFLNRKSPLALGGSLVCSVGTQIIAENSEDYQTIVAASAVEYCYDPARSKRSEYAWHGLQRFGPYSRDTFPKRTPKILVLFPDTVEGKVGNFLRLFRDGIPNSRYSSGFGKTFGLVNIQFIQHKVAWLGNRSRNSPAKAYREAAEQYITAAEQAGNYPDVALVVLLDEHTALPDSESPYLHAKSFLLMAGVPVQEVRLSTVIKSPNSLQYIFENLAVALYAKMNGTPWTVDHDLTISDEIVIGMGSCELSGSRFQERQRHVGITTVFRGDGSYLLGNVSRECSHQEYGTVLRESTSEILRDIKKRNGWQTGDTVRIVVHAFKPLKGIEVADITAQCVKDLCGEQEIQFAFVTVSDDHNFRLLDKFQNGKPDKRNPNIIKGRFAPGRGTIVQMGRFTRLLCTTNANMVKRGNAPLPKPLLVNLHPLSSFRDQHYLTEQALKFTSLSWRSTLPAAQPVSIYYSDLIARLLARLHAIDDWSPAMLNIKLRTSRWFL